MCRTGVGGTQLRVFKVPFHTSAHVAYAVAVAPVATEGAAFKKPEVEAVFSGDTLFSSGPGRFFSMGCRVKPTGRCARARLRSCRTIGPSSAATSVSEEIWAGVDADEGMPMTAGGSLFTCRRAPLDASELLSLRSLQ